MVDFTQSDDAQFMDNFGNTLDKSQFQIGSFVTVDYDKIDSSTTVNTGRHFIRYDMDKKEEKSEVRELIESIIEGILYKEPAIMQSSSYIEPNYYSIIIADLKDDTWDTFELKYDIETDTYTTTRIES